MSFSGMRIAGHVAQRIVEDLHFEAELCLRQTSPRSQCNLCKEVCPVSAIHIERSNTPGHIVDMQLDEELCIHCGLCTTVCPSSAFQWKPSCAQLAQELRRRSALYNSSLYFTCHQTHMHHQSETLISVPCLGMLPWEFWLYLQSSEIPYAIFLPSDLCQQCAITQGEAILLEQITKAEQASQRAIELIDKKEELIFLPEEHDQHYRAARRKFFSSLAHTGRQAAVYTLDTAVNSLLGAPKKPGSLPKNTMQRVHEQRVIEGIEEAEDTKNFEQRDTASLFLTARRQLLLASLKLTETNGHCNTAIELPHINSFCTLCNACAYLCPTEALVIQETALQLKAQACVGCGLCEEICWPKALDMRSYNAQVLKLPQALMLYQEAPENSGL